MNKGFPRFFVNGAGIVRRFIDEEDGWIENGPNAGMPTAFDLGNAFAFVGNNAWRELTQAEAEEILRGGK